MARGGQKFASARPSQADQGGGKFIVPAGAECEIVEAAWTEWQEAGEKALTRNRRAEDPALKLVVQVKGQDDTITEFLGAGKAARLSPSKDGEHLIPEQEGANISAQCNAYYFLDSISNKKQGKKAFDEELIDEPGISSIVGLRFIAGRLLVDRSDMQDDGEEGGKGRGKARPTLVSQENLELPDGKGGSKGGRSAGSRRDKDNDEKEERGSRRSRRDEPEEEDRDDRGTRRTGARRDKDDEDEDRGSRGRSSRGKDKDADPEEEAEAAVVKVLDAPKNRKGIAVSKAYKEVYNVVKESDNEKEIMVFLEDTDWLTSKKRPWDYDKDDDIIVAST